MVRRKKNNSVMVIETLTFVLCCLESMLDLSAWAIRLVNLVQAKALVVMLCSNLRGNNGSEVRIMIDNVLNFTFCLLHMCAEVELHVSGDEVLILLMQLLVLRSMLCRQV